jgi:hypothetical protein
MTGPKPRWSNSAPTIGEEKNCTTPYTEPTTPAIDADRPATSFKYEANTCKKSRYFSLQNAVADSILLFVFLRSLQFRLIVEDKEEMFSGPLAGLSTEGGPKEGHT